MKIKEECISAEVQPTTDAIITYTARPCKAILSIMRVRRENLNHLHKNKIW